MGSDVKGPQTACLQAARRQTKESIPCYVTTHPELVSSWKNTGFLEVKIAAP